MGEGDVPVTKDLAKGTGETLGKMIGGRVGAFVWARWPQVVVAVGATVGIDLSAQIHALLQDGRLLAAAIRCGMLACWVVAFIAFWKAIRAQVQPAPHVSAAHASLPQPKEQDQAMTTQPAPAMLGPARDDGLGSGPWVCLGSVRSATLLRAPQRPDDTLIATVDVLYYPIEKTPIPLILRLALDGGDDLCDVSWADIDSVHETHMPGGKWRRIRYQGVVTAHEKAVPLAKALRMTSPGGSLNGPFFLSVWLLSRKGDALANHGISFGPSGGQWNARIGWDSVPEPWRRSA